MKYPIKQMMLAWLLVFGGSICVSAFGSNVISKAAMASTENTYPQIIIDAGHGGEDGGAVSCTGVKESSINLQISLKLRDTLNLLGYRTHMIRTDDKSVSTEGDTIAARKLSDLRNRIQITDHFENPILISIHQNYFTDSKYYGPQVFYNALPISKEIAEEMQNQLSMALTPESKRRAKRGEGIYLLNEARCGSILVECGFLSNPEEEKLLRSDDYQKKIAAVIGTTLSGFLS